LDRPWCGHCKKLIPAWDALATETKGQINVAKVDCTVPGPATCARFDVAGYPTLLYFNHGKYYKYTDTRDAVTMTRFALEGGFRNMLPYKVPGESTALDMLLVDAENYIKLIDWNPDPTINAIMIGLALGGVSTVFSCMCMCVCVCAHVS
jgi:thiol-disulfide isomerase/thioredoxin